MLVRQDLGATEAALDTLAVGVWCEGVSDGPAHAGDRPAGTAGCPLSWADAEPVGTLVRELGRPLDPVMGLTGAPFCLTA
ncbi:hypothetical protein ACIBAG_36030 [Streptomyces sp. NPDC051243]|uniref:hypothetical protein n=1 Tax=Streptomyces sp. NPDC051243 TaxID=3365646 RepID=UPI00379BF35E